MQRLIGTLLLRQAAVLAAGLSAAFASQAVDHGPLDLQQFRGKVVYLDFWASWCGPCRESFPWLKETENTYRDRGLVVIGVNLDQEHVLAEQFLQAFHPQFRIYFDPEATLAEHFKVSGMPSSVLIDRNGLVRYQHVGFHARDRGEYAREIEGLIGESSTGGTP